MNLYHLRYFVTLAHLEHYTKAADVLAITQPSLSHAISSLEEELGVKLFEKNGRNVSLTKYGKTFLGDVEETLNRLDSSVNGLQLAGKGEGQIDVAFLRTLGVDFVPKIIRNFLTANEGKQINFNLFCDKVLTGDILTGLKEKKYDIGFCSMVENKSDLVFVPITFQELIVIVRNNHPLASHDSIQLSDLQDYTLSTYRDTIPIGKTIRKILKDKGLEAAYSYDDEISIAGRINRSSKVAIVANTPFLKQFDNLKKIHLTDVPLGTRMIYMVYSKKNFITATVESFANFIVAHCLDLPPES